MPSRRRWVDASEQIRPRSTTGLKCSGLLTAARPADVPTLGNADGMDRVRMLYASESAAAAPAFL